MGESSGVESAGRLNSWSRGIFICASSVISFAQIGGEIINPFSIGNPVHDFGMTINHILLYHICIWLSCTIIYHLLNIVWPSFDPWHIWVPSPLNGLNPPMTLGLEDTKMRTSRRSVTTSMMVGCYGKSDRSADFSQMNVVNPNLTMKHRYVYQSWRIALLYQDK